MAGAAGYTAVLDANVLYPALLRDLLLSLADSGLYVARWTQTIEDEWVQNLAANYPGKETAIRATAAAAREAIPDCLIDGYLPTISTLTLPDPDDRHVLAAAIVGHADAIPSSLPMSGTFPRRLWRPTTSSCRRQTNLWPIRSC